MRAEVEDGSFGCLLLLLGGHVVMLLLLIVRSGGVCPGGMVMSVSRCNRMTW